MAVPGAMFVLADVLLGLFEELIGHPIPRK